MISSTYDLDRFLRAVHRRWVVLRAAESIGISVLIGSALALLVLPILLWRDEPAMPPVLTTILAAAACGLVAGVIRRPDVMSAATEADRQLGLADLLSTALATRDRAATDPWAGVVIATADARCRTLAPNDVVLNRFGARAWGGIGLAASLVLTLGLMSANPQPSGAVATSQRDAERAARSPAKASDVDTNNARSSPDRSRTANASAERAHERPLGDATDIASKERASDGQRSVASSTPDGSGGGLARTSTDPVTSQVPDPSRTTASRSDPNGDPSAGGGRAASAADSDVTGHNSGDASTDPAIAPAPAWQSPSWPAARERAMTAVGDGTVPGEYRDLVREYFSPQP